MDFVEGEKMKKSMILLGSALSFALMFGQSSYAADEEDSRIDTVEMQDKEHADEKTHKKSKCHKKHDCKNVKKKLEKIIKKIEESESLFTTEPAKYFKQVSFNAMLLLKAYKCCEKAKDCKDCAPSDQHVEIVKLHATMFEAWANATKEDKKDESLLSNAHDKVPEIIKNAKYLLENCCKKADKNSKEEPASTSEEKDE